MWTMDSRLSTIKKLNSTQQIQRGFAEMNKKIMILFVFALCLVIFAVSRSFQTKNDNLEKKIIGEWEPKLTIAAITSGHSSDPLVFMTDKTMARITPKVNTALGEIGGTSEGVYKIKGNELTTALDLPIMGSTFTMEQTYTIEIKGNSMYMTCMDCGENIGYTKVK